MREALTNAARHAQASVVEVDISVSESTLRLEVLDNGIGIPPERVGRGDGLANMQARAEETGRLVHHLVAAGWRHRRGMGVPVS